MAYTSIKDTIQQIKDSVDIVQVIGKYVDLQEKSGKYWGLSPFKNEKTPSFCVDPVNKFYYCFSTSEGGDVFKFLQQLEHIDFMETVRVLANDLGISLPAVKSELTPEASIDTKVLELCTRIMGTFTYLLWQDSNSTALTYLKNRGLTDETITLFQIGFAPNQSDWLYNFLNSKGYNKQEIAESGLFSKKHPSYSLFRNRIIFPIFSTRGQVIAYGGRIISGDGPKYINSPETRFYKKKSNLFGLYQSINSKGVKKHRKMYLVEGYLDVMAMFQVGFNATIAPLGTAFTAEQAQTIRRLCDSIVLVFDKDEAGIKAAIKTASICEQLAFKSITVIELSENDPADVLKVYGASVLCEQLLEEVEFYSYYINLVFPGNNASIQARSKALEDVVQYLQVVNSAYKRAMYISRTAEIFQVSVDIIEKTIQKSKPFSTHKNDSISSYNITGDISNPAQEQAQPKIEIIKNGEIIVIAALCSLLDSKKEIIDMFRTNVSIADFEDANARTIYNVLESAYRQGSLSFAAIGNALNTELYAYIQSLIVSGEASIYAEKIIADYILHVKINRLKKRSKDIEFQLRIQDNKEKHVLQTEPQMPNSHSDEDTIITSSEIHQQVKELLQEKKFINNEIARLTAIPAST